MASMFELRYEDRRTGLVKDFYKQWRIEFLAAHPPAPIENICFSHNPDWRGEWFSIQHTRNDIIAPLMAWSIDPIKAVWRPFEYRVGEYLFLMAHERSQALRAVRINATGPKIRLRRFCSQVEQTRTLVPDKMLKRAGDSPLVPAAAVAATRRVGAGIGEGGAA
jgi:hypothetical protein